MPLHLLQTLRLKYSNTERRRGPKFALSYDSLAGEPVSRENIRV